MSKAIVAVAVASAFLAMAQPVVAESWSNRLLTSVSTWTPWSSPADATVEAKPSTPGGMLDRAMTAAKAYVPEMPPVATDVAGRASGLVDRAVLYAKSYGPGFPTLDADASKNPEEWSDTVRQSMGCLVSGTGGTVAAMIAGGENLVNVIAGGVVSASNPVVLYTGLFGVVFASFCAIGQALTPLYIQYFTEPTEVAKGAPGPNMLPNARAYYISYP